MKVPTSFRWLAQLRAAPPQSRSARPPVPESALAFRNLRDDEFWRQIPAFAEIDEATFLDSVWQMKNSVYGSDKLIETVKEIAPDDWLEDAIEGFHRAPMAVRVTPYLLSLIDWSDPYNDPIRTQFIPVASRLTDDHPMLTLDSLNEQQDAPVPGLTHRYHDKALFLPLNTCPVYCRFCTRSYAIGIDTDTVDPNTDVLAGLACAEGQLPKWDATNSLWICGDDIDTDTTVANTDTLLTLVCTAGQVAKWDGTSWGSAQSSTDQNLRVVFALSPNDIWVGGNKGVFLHYDGLGWVVHTIEPKKYADGSEEPYEDQIYGIWGAATDDIWAVGANGQIAHWDGKIWKSLDLELPITFRGVYGRAANDVFIVGNQGFAMHFDGEELTTIETGSVATLYDIHGDSEGRVIVVGDLELELEGAIQILPLAGRTGHALQATHPERVGGVHGDERKRGLSSELVILQLGLRQLG